MSDDQLPDDLAALFAAERAAPVAVEGAKALVKAKLAASVVGVPLGASAGLLGAAGKLIGVLALTLGIGAGAIAVSQRGGEPVEVARRSRVEIPAPAEALPEVAAPSLAPLVAAPSLAPAVAAPSLVPVERPPRPARRSSISPPGDSTTTSAEAGAVVTESPVPAPIVLPSPAPPVASQPPPAVALPPPPAAPDAVGIAAPATVPESSLLAQAWSALSRRDAARALVLVREGERAYPAGPLSEEREAIRISALAQLHRRDEAHAAAARFLHRYPHSIHRPLVQRALEETP